MSADVSLCDHFRSLITRLHGAGQTPLALYGAGRVLGRLNPLASAQSGLIACVIDDNPEHQGCSVGGLPVVSIDEAASRGVKAVIITAEGAAQDAIWSKRHEIRRRGMYLLTCPPRFESKLWDGCLLEQLEATMAVAAGIKPLYTRSYPKIDHRATPALASLYLEGMPRNGSVVEIGPGTGLLTEHLLTKCGKYYGVDYSPCLLFEAIEHRFASQLEKMTLLADQSATLRGVPDGSIDLVASFDVFVHIKVDLVHQYLRSIKRVLRPGGQALIHFVQWEPRAIQAFEATDLPAYIGHPNYLEYLHTDQLDFSASHLGLRVETFQNTAAHPWWFMRVTHAPTF